MPTNSPLEKEHLEGIIAVLINGFNDRNTAKIVEIEISYNAFNKANVAIKIN